MPRPVTPTKPAKSYAVLAAATFLKVVVALGLMSMCALFGTSEGYPEFVRQASCVASCVAYVALVCGANLALPDDPRVDPPEGTRQIVRAAATAYMSVASFGPLLAFHSWFGTSAFGVCWIWSMALSTRHLDRLAGHALGGRSALADD